MQLEGLIAYLVNKKDVRGKKALQKLVYFCSEAGVPIHARYRMYIYGPFSNEVAEELSETITKEIVKAHDNGPKFSKGVCCDKFLELYKHEIESNSEKIDRVLEDFGDFTPLNLELYATVHFIASSMRQAYGKTGDVVMDDVKKAKGKKFTRDQIKEAYNDLIKQGWLPKEAEM
jgi:uncharacterized protein YwgA